MSRAGGRPTDAAPAPRAASAPARSTGSPVAESLGLLLKRMVSSLAAECDRRLADHGLTSAQCGLLTKLGSGGRATVCELARSLQVDSGSTTRLLDRLERKRLVTRQRSGEDRRVVWIELTAEGQALLARVSAVSAVSAEVLEAHLAGFSVAESRAIETYLMRMLGNGDARSPGRSS